MNDATCFMKSEIKLLERRRNKWINKISKEETRDYNAKMIAWAMSEQIQIDKITALAKQCGIDLSEKKLDF